MLRRGVRRWAKDVAEKQAKGPSKECAAVEGFITDAYGNLQVAGRPVPYPVTQPAIGVVAGPRMYHMPDWEKGGKTAKEIHEDLAKKVSNPHDLDKAIKKFELAFHRKYMPKTQNDYSNYVIQTCCPGYYGGEWNFNTVWGWKYDFMRAPWYLQGYLKSPNGTGDSGRNPGGGVFWGVVEWVKILVYEGWRLRRNTWRFAVAFTITMIPVQFRDRIYDPLKEQGVDGYIERRRAGKFVNSWGFPGWYSAS